MKKMILLAVLLIALSSLYAQQEKPVQTSQVMIRFKNNFALSNLNAEKLVTGINEIDKIISMNRALNLHQLNTGNKSDYKAITLKFPSNVDLVKLLNELNKVNVVEYAEPDFIGHSNGVRGVSPNDQYYSRQWSLKNDGSFPDYPAITGADIEMEEGWALEQGDSTVIVGIIDTGCKLDHPEMLNRIWKNYNEIPGNGIDEGNNSFIDDVQGWDFANIDNDPTDDEGHGSNVTGIIGANGNNSIGYAGVDWNCKLMILKCINSENWGYYSWWSDAIHYAVDNGAKVINMSVGGSDASTALQDAVNYALDNNVTIVACMMNTNNNTVFYPAAYPGVIAVGSTDPDDKRSHPFFWSPTSGSNYGPHISVVAPGNYIYGLDYQSNTYYGYYWGGTSQATPHVCGLAALLLAQNPKLTPAQIKTLIQSTAEDQIGDPVEDTPGWDQYYGYGRINAHNALLLISGIQNNDKLDKGFTIYPNPNEGKFSVNLPAFPKEKTIASIMNYLGQPLYSGQLTEQNNSLCIPQIPGIYFLKITSGPVEVTKKLIIR